MIRLFLKLLIIGAAGVAAFGPIPAALVEVRYSEGVYPAIQQALTPLSNRVPFALFDLLLLAGAACLALLWAGRSRRWQPGKRLRASLLLAMDALVISAVLYLVFLALWGLNYRRVPLRERIAFDAGRIGPEDAARLAERAAAELNRLAPLAHARPWPALRDVPGGIDIAFATAQRALGQRTMAVPGRPKPTLLTLYFRYAGIDGMTNPYALETIVNGDVLPIERPFVLAHEWAHLAGLAHEAEAGFVAWITCLHADEQAKYSAWLVIFPLAAASLDEGRVRSLTASLSGTVRDDLRAIANRSRRASPAIRDAAFRIYDRFLKANRVQEGVRSYGGMLELVLGAQLDAEGLPRARGSTPGTE